MTSSVVKKQLSQSDAPNFDPVAECARQTTADIVRVVLQNFPDSFRASKTTGAEVLGNNSPTCSSRSSRDPPETV